MLNDEQKKAYLKFIELRDKLGIGTYGRRLKTKRIPISEVLSTVDVAGFNHPFYERNDLYFEYVEAFMAWLAVEPEFRKEERMSMIRGDYGDSDTWKDKQSKVREI